MRILRRYLQEIILGIKVLVQERRYVAAWVFSAALFFLSILLVPVITTPGNDVLFQLHIWKPLLTVVLIVLSVLMGLLTSMQVYALRHRREKDKLALGTSFFGAVSGFIVSIFACAACYSTLLAFVGLGFATFIVKHRVSLLALTFMIVLWAIYRNASRILGHCDTCQLTPPRK